MDIRSLHDENAYVNEFSSDGTRLLADREHIPGVFKLEADKVTFWQPPARSGLSRRQGEPIWSPDGQWLSHGSSIWKSQETDWAKSKWTVPGRSIVSWSPDSKRFLAYAGGSGIEHELWSPHDRKPLVAFEQNHGLFAASWSPDGSQFAMGSGGEVVVLNGTSGQILRRWKAAVDPNEPGQVPSIAWSRRGKHMAVSYDSGAYVIDVADGKLRFALASGYPRMLWGPDDRRLLVVGVQELSVFDGDSGKYQTSFALAANSRAIHFLDQDTALCGTRDGFVYRLDFATGKHEVVTKVPGNIIEISPDGQQLAVNHGGLNIHRLDGQLLTSFLALGDPLQPLIIGADGHFWSNDQPQGPFWATKGSVPHTLVYVVQTAKGQQTLTPVEFANRYGWQNDPSQVRLK